MSGFIGKDFRGRGFFVGDTDPTDGQVLAYNNGTSTWNPTDQLAGIGGNAVVDTYDGNFSSSSSSWNDITGYAVTITPTSATSRVLILFSAYLGVGGGDYGFLRVSGGNATSYSKPAGARGVGGGGNNIWSVQGAYIDSPATTSAITYQMQMSVLSGSIIMNRPSGNTVPDTNSSIIAIEVAA